MGQSEVFDFLQKNKGEWFTCRQVSEGINIPIGSVTMSLKKLRRRIDITHRQGWKRNTFEYCYENAN
jgi:hypothetical protein